jgi:hypothetical protein
MASTDFAVFHVRKWDRAPRRGKINASVRNVQAPRLNGDDADDAFTGHDGEYLNRSKGEVHGVEVS